MEWLLLAFVVGGSGAIGAARWRRRAMVREDRAADLEVVRNLADEDVTVLGEQLRRLDIRLAGASLDVDALADYQAALDCYENAARAVPRLRSDLEVSNVTDALSHGRHAIACVEARVAGDAPPPWRPPCFFDPRHGLSVTDVLWTAPGRGTRKVPACAQDAVRVADHAPLEVRTVVQDGRRVPYWQAGLATAPYTAGYFTASAGMTWSYELPVTPLVGPGMLDGSFGIGDVGGETAVAAHNGQ